MCFCAAFSVIDSTRDGNAPRAEAVRVVVDLAKRVIEVHAVDGAGHVLGSRALARDKFLAWCAQLPAAASLPWKPAPARITGRASSSPRMRPTTSGDDGPQTRRPHLQVGRSAQRPRRLAEGRRGAGQQERTHAVGRDDQGRSASRRRPCFGGSCRLSKDLSPTSIENPAHTTAGTSSCDGSPVRTSRSSRQRSAARMNDRGNGYWGSGGHCGT